MNLNTISFVVSIERPVMAQSELAIKVMKEELEYFTGFYQESTGKNSLTVLFLLTFIKCLVEIIHNFIEAK